MPNLTPNIGLKKPLLNETADIDVLNENFDKIDTEITNKANTTHTHTKANITDFAHKSSHASGGSDALTPAEIGAIANSVNSVTDNNIGNRTVDQTQSPVSSTGTITQLFSWMSNRIKAITGRTNWYDTPNKTLEDLNVHINTDAPHSGHETPAGAQAKVDTHANAPDPHPQYAMDTDLAALNTTVNSHMADIMPHRFVDGGITYKYGWLMINGDLIFRYEEVV